MNGLLRLQQRYDAREARALYELIMRLRFGLSRTDILLGKDTTLSPDDKAELQIIVDRVAKGEPVQYVLGCEEFCGHTFSVGPGVLIPRPETQYLVCLVMQNMAPNSRVLDVGTGSGCIAITLALAGYRVTALDVSGEALAYARKNAEQLGANVEFKHEDIQNLLLPHEEESPYNCIVSNPPYVCESEASEIDENVLLHEPHLALFVPDDDPMLYYRMIADYGLRHLADDGKLFLEINRAYAEQVKGLLLRKGFKDVRIYKDQFDNDRFLIGSLSEHEQ